MATLRYSELGADHVTTVGAACTVGRDGTCDIVLSNDRKVSHRHAEVRRVGDGYVLEDLNSRNGTYVERGAVVTRIESAVPLLPSDVIRIGSTRLSFDDAAGNDTRAFTTAEGVSHIKTPFEPPPPTWMLGKTVRREGAPPPPPTVARQEKAPQTDAERIAELEREVAELSAELRRVRGES